MSYVVWGLDMRFLGRKWQNKNRRTGKGISCKQLAGWQIVGLLLFAM
jgi:hypothetical protein